MTQLCKLCHKEGEIRVSHFIPKFVGKWIKKTSITGHIREHNDVSKRAQDIAKEPWLCANCEELFNSWETYFAKNIFYPFVEEGRSVAKYDSWMAKFCASLSWRTSTYIRSKNDRGEKSAEYNEALDNAETHLSNFLLGKENNLNQYEQHVYPLEKIASTNVDGIPANINRFFLRTMAMDIIGNSKSIFIFTKLPSFIFLGVVFSNESNYMRSSRIALKSSKLSPRQYYWPTGFNDYIFDKAKETAEAHASMPEKDHRKIEKFIEMNPEKAVNSKLFEAWYSDYERFGDEVFR